MSVTVLCFMCGAVGLLAGLLAGSLVAWALGRLDLYLEDNAPDPGRHVGTPQRREPR